MNHRRFIHRPPFQTTTHPTNTILLLPITPINALHIWCSPFNNITDNQIINFNIGMSRLPINHYRFSLTDQDNNQDINLESHQQRLKTTTQDSRIGPIKHRHKTQDSRTIFLNNRFFNPIWWSDLASLNHCNIFSSIC